MGFFKGPNSTKHLPDARNKSHSASSSSSKGPSVKHLLPQDLSDKGPEFCHCVADVILENRYNLLRAEEHARIEGKCGPQWTREVSERTENLDRNRYASVRPWDHSRVLLPVEKGENDYINASWIQLGSRIYIAAQGPLHSTVGDFWHMVYAYGGEPALIVMLTPLYEHAVEKCSKYWPDSKQEPRVFPAGRGFKFGFKISLEDTKQYSHYTWSSFQLIPDDGVHPSRKVNHVYYHSWLDYSKPNADADLHSLIHFINNKLRNPGSPPIIHCSAGIGRTGTFIASDALMAKVDLSVETSYAPEQSPIWIGSQNELAYRPTLFTGPKGHHSISSGPNSPINMLSKYDVSSATSLKSQSRLSTQSETRYPAADRKLHDIPTDKIPVPQEATPRKSVLSEAIQHSTHGELHPLEESIEDQEVCDCDPVLNGDAAPSTDKKDDPEASVTPTGKKAGASSASSASQTALRGPPISHIKARTVEVAPEELRETPETLNVFNWFDPADPVMSCIRCMRKQRPKMVQGKQQLGFIYDQFEVSLQLSRVSGSTSESQPSSFSEPKSNSPDDSSIASSRPVSRKNSLKSLIFHGSFSSIGGSQRRSSTTSTQNFSAGHS